jgi:hypothetical protein
MLSVLSFTGMPFGPNVHFARSTWGRRRGLAAADDGDGGGEEAESQGSTKA